MGVIVEIELIHGYENENGEVHKIVTMRPMRGEDIVNIQKDPKFQELAKDDLSLNTKNIKDAFNVAELTQKIGYFLLSKVVIAIGDLPKSEITPDLFAKFYLRDINIMMSKYKELNGIKEDGVGIPLGL